MVTTLHTIDRYNDKKAIKQGAVVLFVVVLCLFIVILCLFMVVWGQNVYWTDYKAQRGKSVIVMLSYVKNNSIIRFILSLFGIVFMLCLWTGPNYSHTININMSHSVKSTGWRTHREGHAIVGVFKHSSTLQFDHKEVKQNVKIEPDL